jgi:hypothetical protein
LAKNKFIISRVVYNRRNKQPMIFPSKKQMKKTNPDIKFNDDLFVKIQIMKKRPKKK